MLLLAFVPFVLWGVSCLVSDRHRNAEYRRVHVEATGVYFPDSGFVITNNDPFDWSETRFYVNRDTDWQGTVGVRESYSAYIGKVGAGLSFNVPVGRITKPDGTVFVPASVRGLKTSLLYGTPYGPKDQVRRDSPPGR